jgi:hemoglobin-like flavoprotein
MPLSADQKQLAQQAFARIKPQASSLGLQFYSRLFAMEPALRSLFTTDLKEQSHSVMAMLQLCIEGQDESDVIQRTLRNLGERHTRYGAQPHHYALVIAALLWTMQQALGPEYTPEVEAALHAQLLSLTNVMQGNPM